MPTADPTPLTLDLRGALAAAPALPPAAPAALPPAAAAADDLGGFWTPPLGETRGLFVGSGLGMGEGVIEDCFRCCCCCVEDGAAAGGGSGLCIGCGDGSGREMGFLACCDGLGGFAAFGGFVGFVGFGGFGVCCCCGEGCGGWSCCCSCWCACGSWCIWGDWWTCWCIWGDWSGWSGWCWSSCDGWICCGRGEYWGMGGCDKDCGVGCCCWCCGCCCCCFRCFGRCCVCCPGDAPVNMGICICIGGTD